MIYSSLWLIITENVMKIIDAKKGREIPQIPIRTLRIYLGAFKTC